MKVVFQNVSLATVPGNASVSLPRPPFRSRREGSPYLLFLLAPVLLSLACSEARLYSSEGPAAQADRLTLKGRICAEDTLTERLPLRIVLVVDRAAGPLFSDYDPGAVRVQYLRSLVQSALNSDQTEIAVVGFAGRSRTLAPGEGNFTRNPGELLAAVNQLAVPESCAAEDECRDYREGLRTARALIEGDMAQTPAGRRVVTQYVVILVVAGPHRPLPDNRDCCLPPEPADCLGDPDAPSPECQVQLEQKDVFDMEQAVAEGGALGFNLQIIHLAAEEGPVNEEVQQSMREMAFAGSGAYFRAGAPEALSLAALGVLDARTRLRVKALFVANVNARPTPSGPVVDSDADGLDDEEEERLGTEPDNPDTDGDSIGDLVETLVDFDPLEADTPAACRQVENANADSDLDGLRECEEALLGTEPTLVDSDGDGMPDYLEVIGFTDYLDADAEKDTDNDGATNSDELRQRTDPRSTDTSAHLSYGYRYEIEDQGVLTELYPVPLTRLAAVEVIHTTEGTTPGVGMLTWSPAPGTLRWKDGLDDRAGPEVAIGEGGEFDLPSSSYAPIQAEEGRLIRVRVDPLDLPEEETAEPLQIIYREHHCIAYTVRNIRLMDTLDTDGSGRGLNRVVLFFGETPEGHLESPGPFRIAEIPVVFEPPNQRDPASPTVEVLEEEFVRP